MTTLRPAAKITGLDARIARLNRKAAEPVTHGWTPETIAQVPSRPRAQWLEDLRNREQRRQEKISSWRAARAARTSFDGPRLRPDPRASAPVATPPVATQTGDPRVLARPRHIDEVRLRKDAAAAWRARYTAGTIAPTSTPNPQGAQAGEMRDGRLPVGRNPVGFRP